MGIERSDVEETARAVDRVTSRRRLRRNRRYDWLRRLTREHCDLLVRIPMCGAVESLNVAVAAGLCLYESLRRSRPKHPV